MFRRIMVPLDGSGFSEHALPVAIEVARRSGATLDLVRARWPGVPTALGVSLERQPGDSKSEEQDYLSSVGMGVPEDVASSTAVLEASSIAGILCSHAREQGVDLIVMTTHGRGGVSRAWLGSVADRVVRESEVPVLLIRPREDSPQTKASDLFRRILIPLDDGGRTEEIFAPALALGRLGDASYTLLHVITPSTRSEHYDDRRERSEHEAMEEAQADRELRSAAAHSQLDPERVETAVVRHQSPARAILEHAARGSDLIAMATHGRGSVTPFLLGGVADKVLRGATVPVLFCQASVSRNVGN